MSVDNLLSERSKTHGDFEHHAGCTRDLKNTLARWMIKCGNSEMSATQWESLDMICHKLGRIVAGDPNHKDHWLDIEGYARLVSQRL